MKHLFEFVEITIDAITEPDRWTDLADALANHYKIPSATIFQSPLPSVPLSSFFISTNLKLNSSAPIIDHFSRGGDETDWIVYKNFLKAPAQKLVTEESFFGVENDSDLPFCTERDMMFRLLGVRSRLAGALNNIGPWRDILALHSHHRSNDVSPQIFSEMNLLLPVVGKAMNTHRALETLKQAFNAKLAALDQLGFGAALVSRSGAILYSNSYIQDLLSDDDGFFVHANGEIGFIHPETSAAFSEIVQTACAPHLNLQNSNSLTLSVPRRSTRAPYFIKVHAMQDGNRETDVNGDFALLFAIDPSRTGSLSDSGILDLGLLTSSESEVCSHLLSGKSTNQISSLRDVSANTTRTQIKSILSKLRCRDRLHLYQVAFTTHLPIRNAPKAKDGNAITHLGDD